MSETRLTARQAARLLRAKTAELEAEVLDAVNLRGGLRPIEELRADVALIAQLLADHIERTAPDDPMMYGR